MSLGVRGALHTRLSCAHAPHLGANCLFLRLNAMLTQHTAFPQFGEVAVIMAAGAIAIGPRGMPKFARQVGHALGRTVRYVQLHFVAK